MRKLNEIYYEFLKGMGAMILFFLYPFAIFLAVLYFFYALTFFVD